MNTPANPAVTSREAGISPTSSRLRAVTERASRSRLHLPQLEVVHQVLRVGLRAQVVVEHPATLGRGQRRGGDAGLVVELIEAHPGDEVVGQASVDGDEA